MENSPTQRVNSVGFKGQLRKCANCGDVKIWDYPNERKCPFPTNLERPRHRYRPIKDLTEEESESINRQVKYDQENRRHHQIIMNEKGEMVKTF